MKILLATGIYPPDIGGPATYAKLLADELPSKGVSVDVLSFGSVRHLPKLFRHLVFMAKTVWHARSADIIFAQDTVSVGLPALMAALILGKPFILRVPGDHAWEQASQRYGVSDSIDDFQNRRYGWRVEFLRQIQRLVTNGADLVMAPSEYFAGIVRGWVKAPAKVITVYNGIDISAITAIIGTGSRTPKTIISAGRLVPWKGLDLLIRTMRALPEWKLEIAGDGPGRARLEALIKSEGLSGRVSLLGRLDRRDLLRRISLAEAFVLNSSFESFSYQAVEAMASGTPLIAADIGSLPEITDSGRAGRLFRSGDEAGLAAAIRQVSDDSVLRAELSSAGKERAASFSIDTTLQTVSSRLIALHDHRSPAQTRRAKAAKIFRYLLSGGMAAGVNLALLYVFTDIFGIWYLISSALAFSLAFVVSFTLQKFFTFQDHGMGEVRGQAILYLIVALVNLTLNTGIIYLLVSYVGVHYLIAQIISGVMIAIESLVIYGMFIFKKKSNS